MVSLFISSAIKLNGSHTKTFCVCSYEPIDHPFRILNMASAHLIFNFINRIKQLRQLFLRDILQQAWTKTLHSEAVCISSGHYERLFVLLF